MNCPNCGARVEEGASFCPVCGSKVNGASARIPEPQPTFTAAPPAEPQNPAQQGDTGYTQQNYYSQQSYYGQQNYYNSQNEDPRGPVNPYYQRQFEAIAQGEKTRFNWAAFFLGPYHALYRGHTKRFLAVYLPLLLASVILEIGLVITIGAADIMLLGVFTILTWVVALIGLGLAIYNGFTFNRSYYDRCGGDAHVPHHGGRLAALIVTMAVVVIGLCIAMFAAVMGRVMNELEDYYGVNNQNPYSDSVPFDNTPPQVDAPEQPQASSWQDMEELLGAYADIPMDQLYFFGWNDPAAVSDEDVIGSVYLFRSDGYSMLTAFENAAESVYWERVEPQEPIFDESSTYFSIYCTLIEGDVVFDIAVSGGNVVVFGCYAWQEDEYVGLDQQQACALLEAIYERAGIPQSTAYDVRGIWVTSDGNDFIMDAEYLNGQPYTLWFMSEGMLAVYLDNVDGVAGEYFMMVDGTVLNVWQYDEAGNVINDMYYTKEV